MNEQKRRGRPPKAALLEPKVEGADVETRPVVTAGMVVAAVDSSAEFTRRQAQAYANRVWAGQSPSLSRHERLGRIAEALKAQGLSMEGVEL